MRVEVVSSSQPKTSAPAEAPRPRPEADAASTEADGSWKLSAALLAAGAVGLGALGFVATRTPARRALSLGLLRTLAGSSVVRSAVVSAGLGLARWQLGRLFQPSPDYEVEATMGELEIRRYPMLVVAEVNVVARTSGAALNQGFERLAGYIFGKNKPLGTHGGEGKGETIPMTSPVVVQRDGRSWLVRFFMPEGYTLANLPVPDERGIRLRAIAPHRIAALRSRGRFDSERIERTKAAVLDEVHRHGLESMGEPMFAAYDPPSTLPFLRRNEAWIELGRGTERHV